MPKEIQVYICDYLRSPIGRYAGGLSQVRADNLLATVLRDLLARSPNLDSACIDDVIIGCANQAGEDNRNVARMSVLLAGIPDCVSATTVNRLCASSMDAVAIAMMAIKSEVGSLYVAGGVESMSRAPMVMPKSLKAFSRNAEIYDTTIGWRFTNPIMHSMYGTDSMPETAQNVADDYKITRERQDEFALRSQMLTAKAMADNVLGQEITPITIEQRKGNITVNKDEHPRADSSIEALATLKPLFKDGTVTAGNASGINDGAAALIIAGEDAVKKFALKPIARIINSASTGLQPRIMGMGPYHATKKLLSRNNLSLDMIDGIEMNEAFASQCLACMDELGMDRADERLNPLGGAIALGHPLGMSGARLVGTLALQMQRKSLKRGVASMCIGVGQGYSLLVGSV